MMGDRGAGALEVTGLVITVAGVIVALAFTLPEPVTGGLRGAVCRVVTFGDDASCEEAGTAGAGTGQRHAGAHWPKGAGVPVSDQAYMPQCLVESSAFSLTGGTEVLFIESSGQLALVRQVTVDPQTGQQVVTLQAVNAGSLGVGAGAGVTTDTSGAHGGADVSGSVSLGFGAGDGWQFTGENAQEEADALVEGIMQRAAVNRMAGDNLVGDWAGGVIEEDWATDLLGDAGVIEEIPDPTLHTYQGSFQVSAGAELGLLTGNGKSDDRDANGDKEDTDFAGDVNAGVYVSIDGEQQVTYETNDTTGESSVTYMLKGGAGAGANWVAGGATSSASSAGSVKVTKNADGSVKSVTFTQVRIVGGELTETVTEVEPRNDAERELVSEMFTGYTGSFNTQGVALQLTWEDIAPTEEPGEDASPLAQLIYETGKTSRVSYDYEKTSDDAGLSLKLGVEFGASMGTSTEAQESHTAEYLGAPGADGTREFTSYDACEGGVKAARSVGRGGPRTSTDTPRERD